MSSSTGTRKPRNVEVRAGESIIELDKEFINQLKIFSESSNNVAGVAGSAVNNSPTTPAGNYLARNGDSMNGPLALGPPLNFRVTVDSNDTINIGPLDQNSQYSSNVQLDDINNTGTTSSTLEIIAGAAFDGQILILRTFAPSTEYTIAQATAANGGNIQTPASADISLGDLQTMVLIFDESTRTANNTGGIWRVVSVTGAGGGGGGGSPLTTKGDIYGFSTENARIPVGANGQVLLADSTQALGVRWGAVDSIEFVGPWTANHNAGTFSLTNIGSLRSATSNIPNNGFIRMASGDEIRMRNPDNDNDLIITSGDVATNMEGIRFQVAGGDRLTVSELNIDAKSLNIINTGNVTPTGSHSVGDVDNFYNQMHSQYFIPQASSNNVVNRYGLAQNSSEIYINYDDSDDAPASAGFAIRGQGNRQFRFYNPVANTIEFMMGPDPFNAGETYRIIFGENSQSSGVITFTEGTGNDLIINRNGGNTSQGVQIRASGLTVQRWFTDRTVLSLPLDAAGNELRNVVNIKSNGAGMAPTGTIGELITANGGFNYFVRDSITWQSNENTQITFANTGIDILTDGAGDHIDLTAAGGTGATASNINLTCTGNMTFTTAASTGMNFVVGTANRLTVQNNAIVMSNDNTANITFSEDEIEFRSGRAHQISATSTSLQLFSENTGDSVQIWNGTSATNETLLVGNATSIFKSKGGGAVHTLLLRSSNPTITGQPAIGNFGMEAADSDSGFGAYAGIAAAIESGTSTARNGRMQLVVASNNGTTEREVSDLTGIGVDIQSVSGTLRLGFYGDDPVSQRTVAGSRGGNAALGSLLTALDELGLIDNRTTA